MIVSAKYQIEHVTEYQYADPVAICQNQLRMTPTSRANSHLKIDCHRVETYIAPEPEIIGQHIDYFGNVVHSFSIESLHRQLQISVHSEATVTGRKLTSEDHSAAWGTVVNAIRSCDDPNWHRVNEFCFDSPRIHCNEEFRQYASESFVSDRGVLECSFDLTRRINEDFDYDTNATDVNTPTRRAFDIRAGVCQDFAHVQLACLRSIGVPARYVSGYLRTVPPQGEQALVGTDESHAWVSIYLGQQIGWVDFDPTNACLCDANHIPVCIGRDYSEVCPMRGVVLGGGETTLNVSVDVREINDS